MPIAPLVLTEADVQNPNLLLRHLRKVSELVQGLQQRVDSVEARPLPPTLPTVRSALQSTGATPLNVTGLSGVLTQPQPASATVYTLAPTDQVLQSLRDQQLVAVGNTSTGYALNLVIGGNPNSLYQLISNLTTATISSTSTNLMTLDTVQTSTGSKTLSGQWDFTSAFRAAGAAGFAAGAGVELNYASSNGNVFSIDRSAGLFKSLTIIGNTIVFQTSSGTGMSLSTSAAVTITNKITSYNGNALTGNGVPTIVAMASGSGLSGTQTAALFTPPAQGRYRVSYYLYSQTTGTDTIAPTYLWTDSSSSHSFADVAMPLNSGFSQFGDSTLLCGTTTTIRFQAASAAGTGTYSFVCTLERLS